MAIKLLSDWDFLTDNVQNIDAGDGGEFLSAESTVLCAGPRTLAADTTKIAPIGLVQNAQLSQNRQVQQLFEVGSRKPFFVPGRTLTQVGLSRVIFDGPSLMKALYTVAPDSGTAGVIDNFSAADQNLPASPYNSEAADKSETGDFFINLASEFFNRPMGLAFVFKDMEADNYAGVYLENCYIQTHSLSMSGQQTVLLENVGIRATTVVPFSLEELGGSGDQIAL